MLVILGMALCLFCPLGNLPLTEVCQPTGDTAPVLVYCRASVADAGPARSQHWILVNIQPEPRADNNTGKSIYTRLLRHIHNLTWPINEIILSGEKNNRRSSNVGMIFLPFCL